MRREAHFLSEWQGRSEVKQGGRQSVSHQHPSALSLSSDLLYNLCLLHFFFRFYISSSSHPLLYPPTPFVLSTRYFSLSHSISCCSSHDDMLSPQSLKANTRAGLTISPIQPPKSNYHGQNRVIKSNGLLYEVHAQQQNKSFSSLMHNILFVTYILLDVINWLYSPKPQYTDTVRLGNYSMCYSVLLYHTKKSQSVLITSLFQQTRILMACILEW